MKTWRRLQQLGAVALKSSLYVLPYNEQSIEDFEWFRSEVTAHQGHASLFSASSVTGVEDADIVQQFQTARNVDYRALRKEVRAVAGRLKRGAAGHAAERTVRQLRERFGKVQAIDFFHASEAEAIGRELMAIEDELRPRRGSERERAAGEDVREYQHRVWVTRPRPGVDRMASAWLITRFIDRHAQFKFVQDVKEAPAGALPFDMFGGGFAHEGDLCTFEVLCDRFRLRDQAIAKIGTIVHDLDLKEPHLRLPDFAGVSVLIDGLRAGFDDDSARLSHGIDLFDALYRGFQVRETAPTPFISSRRKRRGSGRSR